MMQKRALASSAKAATPARGQLLVTRAQALTASDLAAFKIIDLVELAGKKGCSPGRNATRDSVVNALVRAGVTHADLTKGQLADLKQHGGSSSYSAASATSSGDRFANYSRSGSASPSSSYSAGSSSGATLSAGDLSAFKIVDLVEIAAKKGVSGGRNATRESLTNELTRAGVSLNDLTRGQLVDLGIKLGKAGLSRDINQARAELASLIGGSGSAPSSWRSTPAPAASTGDRIASYSSSRPAATPARGGSAGAGAKLGAGDLAHLRIDDLRDLVKKTGAELPREPTKDNVINGLIAKGVSLNELTRGMLVDLSTKLGAPLAKDVDSLRRNLSSLVGGSGSSASSWRSTPAAAAAPAEDRWSKYSAGATQSASWRRSGSHNASGSKLSTSDLAHLRIDDLRDLVKKTGAQLPREPTKDGVISALISKGVSLNDLTRGMLVDLANKLGAPLAKDVDSLRKSLSSAVGKGGYSPAASSPSPSSWRTAAPAPAASNGSGDRWANYSRSAPSGGNGTAAAGGNLSASELNAFKIDTLSELARKKGISMRNATKQDLVSQLSRVLKKSDLSKAQLGELQHCLAGARR